MALVLNGTSDYVGPYPPALPSAIQPTAVTVSCWVNLASLANAYTAIASINGAYYYQLFVTSAGKLAIYVGANAQVEYDPGTAILTTGKWYHLAFTYSAATGLAGYVNGVVDQTVAANGPLSNQTSLLALTFGTDLVNAGRFLNGSISDASLYNQALSATEIAQLASGLSPLGVRRDALVCYWPMKSGADRAVDLGPNSLPLYLAGSTILSTRAGDDPPFLIRPRYVLSSIPAEGEMPALFNPVVLASGSGYGAPKRGVLRAYSGGLSLIAPRTVPRGKVQIDWSHPLTNGLIACYLPGVSFLNLTGKGADLINNASDNFFSVGSDGPAWSSNNTGGSGLYNSALPPVFTSLTRMSIYTRFYPVANSNNFNTLFGIDYDTSPATDPFYVFSIRAGSSGTTGGTNQIVWNSGGPGTVATATFPQLTAGVVASIGATGVVGGNVIGYNNGVSVVSTSFGASNPGTIATSPITIATSPGGSGRAALANTFCAYMWNRDLSASEMAMLDADPYGFLMPAEGEMPSLFLAAAGGSFLAAWARYSNRPVIGTGNY